VATRAVKAGKGRLNLAPGPGAADTGLAGPARARPALVPPGWVPITTTVLCAIALADSAYLTWIHYTNPTGLFCSTTGIFNCDAVTTSVYSHPFGIPVAVAGLAWSFVMLLLCSPRGWRASSRWVSPVRLAGSVAGVGMVFYLIYRELFSLSHICEYCTVVHVMTIALFIVVAFGTALGVPADDEDEDEDDLDLAT
jgi:uncharacterized membrane protein